MGRYGLVIYGLSAYLATWVVTVYCVAFFGNITIQHSVDGMPRSAVGWAISVNVLLLLMFGLQHSWMARKSFKNSLARYLPAAAERSTYLFASCFALGAVLVGWQPVGLVVWDLPSSLGRTVVYVFYFLGWFVIAWTIWLIDHADMFGLRQVWCYAKRQTYEPPGLVTPGPYRWCRHPMYVGWLLVFWATPIMTAGHFAVSVFFTLYILIAVRWEERDLVETHGVAYRHYRSSVAMLFPIRKVWCKIRFWT